MTRTPLFTLQIVHGSNGPVATLPSGRPLELDFVKSLADGIARRGAGLVKTEAIALPEGFKHEHELCNELTEAVVKRGVGFLKTENQVKEAVRNGLHDVLVARGLEIFKAEALVYQVVLDTLQDVIQGLKDQTQRVTL